MKINGIEIKMSSVPPTETGTYIFTGAFLPDRAEILHVVKVPPRFEYGVHWDEYLAVANHSMRNVDRYMGKFVKIEL